MECIKLIVFQGVFSFYSPWLNSLPNLALRYAFFIGRRVCGDYPRGCFALTHICQTIPSHPNIPCVVTSSNSPLFVLFICTWWILYYINS